MIMETKMKIGDWLIHKFGGYTSAEYLRQQNAIHKTIEWMKRQGHVTVIEGNATLFQVHVQGTLVVAPGATASVINCYFESSYDRQL